jgi:DNA-binding NarL/FixJ family response regulator
VMRPVNDPLRVGSGLLEAARLARSLGDVSAAQRLAEEAAAVLEAIDAGEEAMARALLRDLAGGVRRPTPKRPRSGWESLTATELRVVAAVVDGCSNPQVAERLFVSRHTVESHLKHIYVKLGITSRVELAAEAVRRAMTANP